MFSYADFESERNFVAAFSAEILECAKDMPEEIKITLKNYAADPLQRTTLSGLFRTLMELCRISERKIVLLIT